MALFASTQAHRRLRMTARLSGHYLEMSLVQGEDTESDEEINTDHLPDSYEPGAGYYEVRSISGIVKGEESETDSEEAVDTDTPLPSHAPPSIARQTSSSSSARGSSPSVSAVPSLVGY